MQRILSNILLRLSLGEVECQCNLITIDGFSIERWYTLNDAALIALAQSENLDTWDETHVVEQLDTQFPFINPVTQETVTTTFTLAA